MEKYVKLDRKELAHTVSVIQNELEKLTDENEKVLKELEDFQRKLDCKILTLREKMEEGMQEVNIYLECLRDEANGKVDNDEY